MASTEPLLPVAQPPSKSVLIDDSGPLLKRSSTCGSEGTPAGFGLQRPSLERSATDPLHTRSRPDLDRAPIRAKPAVFSRVQTLAVAGVAGGLGIFEDESTCRLEVSGNSGAPDPGFAVNLLVGIFSVFQGATDGLSLGSIIFPAAAPAQYKSLGMSLGLLSAFVSNAVSCFGSQFPHAVGGAVMPVIPIMAAFFSKLGPENCPTILFAMPFMTLLCGILTYIMGKIGVQDIVKACPFVVFGGFIAGTGAQLLEFALNMMYPKFVSFKSLGTDGLGAFLETEFWIFCGPGLALAAVVFLVPRLNPSGQHTFLLPTGVIVLAVLFYATLLATGTSVQDARSQGWLFDMGVPSSPDFYKVWTMQDFGAVRWDLIFSRDFFSTTLQVFLMGFLTTTKNIYGTSEFTHCHIDIDKEIRQAGIQGVFCGLSGGMPGNIVMSFSITAHSLGVRTKAFSAMLATLSFVFFLLGDYAIAVLPKMVPAGMLFWLGIILVISWIWDMVGSMSAAEHSIVILMIFVDIFLDPGTMIVLGLFLTLVVTVKRMMEVKFITSQFTLLQFRSDVLRTGDQANVIAKHAKEVLVLRLAYGYFSFTNASSVMDYISEAIGPKGKAAGGGVRPDADTQETPPTPPSKLQMLVLDFQDILHIDTTALNALADLRSTAARREFLLVLCSCQPAVEHAIRRFGVPAHPEKASVGLDTYEEIMQHAPRLAQRSCSQRYDRLILIGPLEQPQRFAPAMTVALEFSERLLLSMYQEGGQPPSFPAARRTAMGQAVKNSSLLEARKELLAGAGLDPSTAALPLLVDIHCWLSGYMSTYKQLMSSVMPALADVLEVHNYCEGEVVYEFTKEAFPDVSISDTRPGDHVPPLLWLLSGEVEHTWAGHLYPFSHFRGIEDAYNLQPHQRLEKAELPADNVHYCVGPFQTDLGFKGSMMHTGRLVATQPSHCVLLRRAQYDALVQNSPEALDVITAYLARKRFVITSLAKVGGPRLFL